jgi:hypothetical protein
MRKVIITLAAFIISLQLFSAELVLIPTGSPEKTKELFCNNKLVVNYYNDLFAVATSESSLSGYTLLDDQAWKDPETLYYVLFFDSGTRDNYLNEVSDISRILYQGENFVVVSIPRTLTGKLYPVIHGGMVSITNRPAQLPVSAGGAQKAVLSTRADIEAMIAQVNADSLQATVQRLQDYGTRNAYSSQGIEAQNWIFSKFSSYGLDVELNDFTMPNGPASDNIIATITGTRYPDEIVVLGAHYDSYAYGGTAPGADDNATGTAGILEAARIMSQYSFDRTIIFATWSGEEYGLYGSEAWASDAAASGMNILGYFNIDMAGYLEPGGVIHTDVIAPSSAQELVQFYKDVCAIYLPDFVVSNGALSGGDSDHTSFNQNGYMGIFPFEDSQNYSPYIHSADDLIGPSVNSFEMHATFVQAIIASVVSMSDQLPSPENLVAVAGDAEVSLSWTGLDSVDYYNIYRDGNTTPFDISATSTYTDTTVVNGTAYTYSVTAIFSGSGEESGPSNEVTVVPMPPIALPFFDDYETGGPYWTFEQGWGLVEGTYYSSSHSMTESPEGNYLPNMNSSATLRAVNFVGAYSAQVSFFLRYRIEEGYDYLYLEVSTDGNNWDQLDSFTGNQLNWGQKTYALTNYLNEPNVTIRFRFTSDEYVEDQGVYIDDIEIDVVGVGIGDPGINASDFDLKFQPNPAGNRTALSFNLASESLVKISLADSRGRFVREIASQVMQKGPHSMEIDAASLQPGTYYCVLETEGQKITRKLVIIR